MGALHRLQWIDQQIRAGRYPNTRQLAETFELSRAQAQRDFDYLRDRLGAPLVYVARHRGFSYENAAFVLPGPYVSPEEQLLLIDLATYYGYVGGQQGPEGAAYRRMSDLIGRIGGFAAAEVAVSGVPSGIPYRAVLRAVGETSGGVPFGLEGFCLSAENPAELVCEFYDPERFLAVLMIVGGRYRLERPRWLRERLLNRLAQLQTVQA